MTHDHDDAMWLHARAQVSIVELAESSGLPEPVLRELVEYGALAPADPQAPQWVFSGDCLVRVRTAARLRNDLELETPALALVLSLLDEIHRLDREVRHLGAQLSSPLR
jgi:chaperone modulatory protein CbpM